MKISDLLTEAKKPKPTNPKLCSQAKAQATRVLPETPPYLYHVSRQSNRASIISGGLKPQNTEFTHIHRHPAIHGFETIAQAKDWAFFFAMDIGEPVDIWKLDVQGMLVKLDPSVEMQEAYDSWIVTDLVHIDRLRRVGQMQAHTSTAHAPPLAKKIRPKLAEAKKPKPTNPKLWSQAKAQAKRKFEVYPSAYANGWAAAYYKRKGGKWRMK